MAIIDATDLIVGRMATYIAKQALEGTPVTIVNCEKAVITGKKTDIIAKHQLRQEIGHPTRGPIFPREPDFMLKRSIRGMLPHKTAKGKAAFKRIMCYVGVPSQFKEQKAETLQQAHISSSNAAEYTPLGEVCKLLGAKKVMK
jgi:large subunit ribosomal protein L13